MACRICGETKARYCSTKLQRLCKACNQETKPKVTPDCFEAVYWRGKADTVPPRTRREFYSDYLASKGGLAEYIAATTCYAG